MSSASHPRSTRLAQASCFLALALLAPGAPARTPGPALPAPGALTQGPDLAALAQLEGRVERAFFEADADALRDAAADLGQLGPDDHPRVAYVRGLAHLHRVTLGEAGGDPMATLDAARTDFDRAASLGLDEVPLYISRIWCHAQRMMADAGCSTTSQPAIDDDARAVMRLDPSHPSLRLMMAMNGMAGSFTTAAMAEGFEATLTSIEEDRARAGGEPDWFLAFAYLNLARAWLMLGEEGVEAAGRVCARGLERVPEFRLLRQLIPPQLEAFDAVPVETLAALEWRDLCDDPEGDGTRNADATSLAWALDSSGDRLWFRFEYAERGAEDRVSVNLAFDTDGDDTNGIPWWSGATRFMLDRAATLWVNRTDDGRWRGLVGMTDAGHARAMIMNAVSANTLALCVDGRQVAVGIPLADFGDDLAPSGLTVLGAVGLGMAWSDDIGAPARLDLQGT